MQNLPIGSSKDWKFGLVTREVYRVSEDLFEINDTSHGWQTAMVDLSTLESLLNGSTSLTSLDWH